MYFEPEKILRIIDLCIEGKEVGFKALFFEYHAFGKVIALRHASNPEDAEEILNDTFLKIYNNIKNYDKAKSFKAWFRKIIINTCIDYYRRQNKMNFEFSDDTTQNQNEADEKISFLSAEEILIEVQKLTPALRTVFLLHAVEGYEHKEIAGILQISEITSRTSFHKAKEKLQILLINKGLLNPK